MKRLYTLAGPRTLLFMLATTLALVGIHANNPTLLLVTLLLVYIPCATALGIVWLVPVVDDVCESILASCVRSAIGVPVIGAAVFSGTFVEVGWRFAGAVILIVLGAAQYYTNHVQDVELSHRSKNAAE